MPITLKIDCPDHLRTVYDEHVILKVENDSVNQARDLLVLWLSASKNGVWVSTHPTDAQEFLNEQFLLYPHISLSHIEFVEPHRLTRAHWDRCVIEDVPEFDVSYLHCNEIRLLQRDDSTIALDSLGLSIEDRKVLLNELRQGSSINYDEHELIASITRESFYEFIKEFWGQIIAETPVWNWHINYLAKELQYIAARVFAGKKKEYDLIINVPPGSTKSTLASIMFPAWTWTNMPSARYLGGSYVDTLAMDLSRRNKMLVESNKYKEAFPEIKLSKDQAAKSHFVNTKGGSRYSFGVQGTVTGMHAHFIGVDDPLNPEKAVSEVELEKANRVMSETLFTRKVDKELTPTILIMQRLHQNDPTQHMIDKYDKVKQIVLPADILSDQIVLPVEAKKFYIEGFLDPRRLSADVLRANFKALGEFSYAGQFDQHPVPRGGAMFKPDRITIDVAPADAFFKMIIRYWDKAGTQGAGCYTAGVKIGLDKKDRFWLLNVVRGQWAMDEREANILQTAKLDGHHVQVWVEQEPGSGGKDQAYYTVKNLRGYRVKVDPVGASSGNKTVRAGPFADQVNGHNVWMAKGEWNKDCIEELRYFPASKYKDQVDGCSGGFNKLTKGEIRVGTI